MLNLFISYNRESEGLSKSLVADIQTLGHSVWLDQELSGGQVWWDQILTRLRDCDVLVFLVSPASLDSTACKLEYEYAAELGKPILPVLVADGVSANVLPPVLSKIQLLDYRERNRAAAFRLAKALSGIRPPDALPDPLPAPPEVPVSYLGTIAAQIEATESMSYERQSAVVIDLRKNLRDPGTAADARVLLQRMRERRDLLANIADELDEMLASPMPHAPGPRQTPRWIAAGTSIVGGLKRIGAFKREPDRGTGRQDPPRQGTAGLPGKSGTTSIANGALLVASLAFIVFCIHSAVVYDGRWGSWDRSAEADLHARVTIVSLVFYGSVFVVLLIGLRKRARLRYWRHALGFGLLGCVGMAIWSLLLSSLISFNEVWPAWLISGAYFAGLSIWGLRRGS
ncbi:MAG: toll/interleukin-1 receptor domain-containing protein [Planctomycetota bacterium]